MSFLTLTRRKPAFDFSAYLQRYCGLARPGGMLASTASVPHLVQKGPPRSITPGKSSFTKSIKTPQVMYKYINM